MSRWIWHLLPLPPCAYIRAVYAADLTYMRTSRPSEHLCDGWAKTVCASYSWKMGKVCAAKKARLSLKGYPKKAKAKIILEKQGVWENKLNNTEAFSHNLLDPVPSKNIANEAFSPLVSPRSPHIAWAQKTSSLVLGGKTAIQLWGIFSFRGLTPFPLFFARH